MVKNYYHFALKSNRSEDVRKLKQALEDLNISNPTEDEIFELLLEKNKKFVLSPTEVKKIISKKRGIEI